MTKQLNLYSTSHCHLCELAYSLVIQLSNNIEVNLIEIAENEALLTRYGSRIPVLQRQDTQSELDWPFNETSIREFLK
ncbi:MAG: glutaredoxin family protein [Methylotenera sp.]